MSITSNGNVWLTIPQLRDIQAVSGGVLSGFVGLHMTTLVSATMGPYSYNEALNLFRRIYQNPWIEGTLAVSIVGHVAAGIMLFQRRPKESAATIDSTSVVPWYTRLNRWCGTIVAVSLVGHVAATRVAALLGYNKAADYDSIRLTMTDYNALAFIPYYTTFLSAGIYHTLQSGLYILCRYGVLPSGWHEKISEHPAWFAFILSCLLPCLAGLFSFNRIPGIPENAAYWSHSTPGFLQRANTLSHI